MTRLRIAMLISLMMLAGSAADLLQAAQPKEKKPMVAHNVYFTLEDAGDDARNKLIADCHAYLADIPGTVFYAAGVVADLDRPVNDRDFDVGLHVVFENEAALHAYLIHPQHLEFVNRNKENWAKVRVFDSEVRGKP